MEEVRKNKKTLIVTDCIPAEFRTQYLMINSHILYGCVNLLGIVWLR